jgi:hypothetical protein
MLTALKEATDYTSPDSASRDKLAWAVSLGFIKGTDNKSLTINPASSVKRDEV